MYNAVRVKHCADNYDPVMDHVNTTDKAARSIVERFDYIKIGVVRLIQKGDVVKLSKMLNGHQDKVLSQEKIGKRRPKLEHFRRSPGGLDRCNILFINKMHTLRE